MTDLTVPSALPSAPISRRGRISLRTLMLIRWVAIVGQLVAVLAVYVGFDYDLPLVPALAIIGVSVLVNGAAMFQGRWRVRLGERDAMLYLAYDVLQLGALLYLTGGLGNPFSVLLLAPLTAGATILRRKTVVPLTVLVLLVLALLALVHLPLPAPVEGGQATPGVTTTLMFRVGVWAALTLAALFIAAYVWRVSSDGRRLDEAYAASQSALARAQRLSALGALAAAAAHELGTPLSTIALVAKELQKDLPPDSPLAEDINLLASESERCRTILSDLTRHPEADAGEPYSRVDLPTLIALAAQPHETGRVALEVDAHGEGPSPQVWRTPERLHGLGNILQNALQFARREVHVDVSWDDEVVVIRVIDDGPGFPAPVLSRLGEPYVSGRSRGRHGHMGLGIFIASAFLERDGATLRFANGRSGAEVVVTWPRPTLELVQGEVDGRFDAND
ncbi:MAG: ActS/PrrB/RegB family redox-sensitive histidine kinase [Pseudomonadota bacterium]